MSWGASRAALIGALTGALVTCGVALTGTMADAKSTYESPYGYMPTWNAALRLVRVDNNWKITEQDKESGYLLFDYESPESGGKNKTTPGTLEIVRGRETDAPVSVLIQLPQMPHYHEQQVLDQLASKMRREYGDPPERKKRRDPAEGPDAGDAGTD